MLADLVEEIYQAIQNRSSGYPSWRFASLENERRVIRGSKRREGSNVGQRYIRALISVMEVRGSWGS